MQLCRSTQKLKVGEIEVVGAGCLINDVMNSMLDVERLGVGDNIGVIGVFGLERLLLWRRKRFKTPNPRIKASHTAVGCNAPIFGVDFCIHRFYLAKRC